MEIFRLKTVHTAPSAMNGQILATFGNLYASAVKNCLFLDYYGVAKAKFGQRNYGGTLNEIVHYNPFSKARVCVCVCVC